MHNKAGKYLLGVRIQETGRAPGGCQYDDRPLLALHEINKIGLSSQKE